MTTTEYTEEQFLQWANGKARTRLFGSSNYAEHISDVAAAGVAAQEKRPFYTEDNTGGVANAYHATTTTARRGVYVDPITFAVVEVVDRVPVSSRSVKRIWYGGEQGYNRAWRDARQAEEKAKSEAAQ